MKIFTELEKTIIFSLFLMGKGGKKYVKEDDLVRKFPMRQRRTIRRLIKKLWKNGYFSKKSKSYTLTKKGLSIAKRLLHEGVSFV